MKFLLLVVTIALFIPSLWLDNSWFPILTFLGYGTSVWLGYLIYPFLNPGLFRDSRGGVRDDGGGLRNRNRRLRDEVLIEDVGTVSVEDVRDDFRIVSRDDSDVILGTMMMN